MYEKLSKIEQEFIKEVKRNGGGLTHDLNDPLHYTYVAERLGGESLLKESFPSIYEMLVKTKKADSANDVFKPDENGLSNDIHIRSVEFVRDSAEVSAQMNVGLTKASPWIKVDATLIDAENGEKLDIINKFVQDTSSFLAELRKGLKQEKKTRVFSVIANFQYGTSDGTGAGYTEVYEDLKVYGEEDILDSVEVLHPTPQGYLSKNNTFIARDVVKVLYNRINDNCDYHYDVVTEDYKAKLKLPVCVKVKVNDKFRITGIDEEKSGYVMIKNGSLTDAVHYYGDLDAGCFLRSIPGSAEEEKIFILSLPDEWENTINTTAYHSCEKVDLTGSFTLTVEHKDGFDGVVGILFSSEEEQQGEKTGKLKPISFLWGCLSKDTPVLMEDGSFRPVCELEPGDKVRNKDGEAVSITRVTTGREEMLVVIRTETGKIIKVTKDHPILTDKGMKRADRICYLGKVATADGLEEVTELYAEDYGDLIYSLSFDEPQIINSGGIYTGDFEIQNLVPACNELRENAEAADPILINELKRLTEYLNQERK